jgi:site-specific recombinase XerD
MLALIEQYQKKLSKINGFADSTVETYCLSIRAFCDYTKTQLEIDPLAANGKQLLKWIQHLKNTGIGFSRLEIHHYALKSFYAFLQDAGLVRTNPAEPLPYLIKRQRERTHAISSHQAFSLLDSFDRNTWHGLKNYTMVSILWALGLRTSELTALRVKDFETGHGKRIALLRIHGKNKKQRALFVVDRLFDQLTAYLAHPKAPKKKRSPLFVAETKETAISNNRVQRLVKDQARRAGIDVPVTPRVLRHSFATEMYHQNVPLEDISAMMGHDKAADTAVYVHVSDKLKQLALDQIHVAGELLWL